MRRQPPILLMKISLSHFLKRTFTLRKIKVYLLATAFSAPLGWMADPYDNPHIFEPPPMTREELIEDAKRASEFANRYLMELELKRSTQTVKPSAEERPETESMSIPIESER